MSYQTERYQFVARCAKFGIDATPDFRTSLGLLRCATTLQRLAEAQCNGDWPADNGNGKTTVCPRCESLWRGNTTVTRKGCPDCRTQDRANAFVVGTGWRCVFGGDPRGAVLRIVPETASREDVECGRERGIYVPTR